MKITPANLTTSASASGGGSGGGGGGGGGGGSGGPVGGDLGNNLPNPTVTGLQGRPVCIDAPTTNDVLTWDGSSWCAAAGGTGGLSSITDGTTTITPVTDLTVSPHSLSGSTPNATIGYVTPTYGGQETLNTVAATGSTETLPATANVHDLTLTANCTITLPTLTTGKACAITVILRQDGTGSRLVTWPGSVSWVDGSAPTLKTAAAAVDLVTLFTLDGGTTWGGAAVGAAGASFATPAIVLGTAAAAGAATTTIRSDATIVAFDAAIPLAPSGSGSAGSGAIASRSTHVHPATEGAFGLLISDTPSTPLIFADIIQNEAQADLVYADS